MVISNIKPLLLEYLTSAACVLREFIFELQQSDCEDWLPISTVCAFLKCIVQSS